LQQFAIAAGVGAPALSALERGEEPARVSTLFAAAAALKVSVSALFSTDEGPAENGSTDAAPPAVGGPPAPPARQPQQFHLIDAPPAAPPAAPTRVPRTFADLRTGPLEGRTFDSLQQFAVAAVIEANHAVSVIARVFRVPGWKLQAWVDEHQAAPARPQGSPSQRSR
jgi:hypothetical protein